MSASRVHSVALVPMVTPSVFAQVTMRPESHNRQSALAANARLPNGRTSAQLTMSGSKVSMGVRGARQQVRPSDVATANITRSAIGDLSSRRLAFSARRGDVKTNAALRLGSPHGFALSPPKRMDFRHSNLRVIEAPSFPSRSIHSVPRSISMRKKALRPVLIWVKPMSPSGS